MQSFFQRLYIFNPKLKHILWKDTIAYLGISGKIEKKAKVLYEKS